MAGISAWLDTNWFNFLQSIGIIGGLAFTAFALRMENRARRVSDFLVLTGHHRELWIEIQRQPSLARILQPEVNLIDQPITWAEEEFLNLVYVHFQAGWELARRGSILKMRTLRSDANYFLKLPIPRSVWAKTTGFRDAEFVRFMDEAGQEQV